MSDASDSEFEQLFGKAKPVKNDRVNLLAEKPKPKPRSAVQPAFDRDLPDAPVESSSTPVETSYFSPGLQRKLKTRIQSGSIRPQAKIDLHGLRAAAAKALLQQFIADARQRGLRMLLVIHGQGYGSERDPVLKPLVHRYLAERSDVLAWCPAQRQDGAGGATYIFLKNG